MERRSGERLTIVKGKKTMEEADPGTKRLERADWSELLLKQAISIANKVKANAILVNMETVAGIAPFGKTEAKKFKVIL